MQKNTQYTRCPQCDTAFKVTDKMLAMAHGKVRCGACLEVFLATDHLLQPREKISNSVAIPADDKATVSNEEEPAPAVSQESSPHQEPQIGDLDSVTADIDEDLSIDSPVDISEDLEQQNTRSQQTETFDSLDIEQDLIEQEGLSQDDFEQESSEQESSEQDSRELETSHQEAMLASDDEFSTPEDDDLGLTTNAEVDEDLELSLSVGELSSDDLTSGNNDLDIAFDATETETEATDLDESFESDLDSGFDEEDIGSALIDDEPSLDLDTFDGQDDLTTEQTQSSEQEFESDLPETEIPPVPQSDQESLLEEDSDIDAELDTIELQLELQQSEQADDLSLDEEEESLVADPDLSEFDSEQIAMEDQEQLDQLSQTLTAQISDTDTEPDPLDEFEGRVEKKKTSLRTLVIAATAIILVTVLSVNFWSNRQTLAWDDTWGGFTQAVCGVLPCDIQPQRDVTKIRLRQRIVTPSEDKENQLDVKILLTNEAPFPQPYPKIIIIFSNSSGEQVAIREFEVAEYFPSKQGELMAAGTEIHIAFSTEQPHPDALGFEFRFQ